MIVGMEGDGIAFRSVNNVIAIKALHSMAQFDGVPPGLGLLCSRLLRTEKPTKLNPWASPRYSQISCNSRDFLRTVLGSLAVSPKSLP